MPYAALLMECSSLQMHHMVHKILPSDDYTDLMLIGIEKEQRIMVQIVLNKQNSSIITKPDVYKQGGKSNHMYHSIPNIILF